MEQNCYKPHFKTIAQAATETLQYIKDRRDHVIVPLKTRWKKFNKVLNGGIEPNTVYTVAGASGTGKSSFVNTLETDLVDLNSEDIVILSFSFEMLSSRQVGRKISNKLKVTTAELYSADTDISDNLYKKVKSKVSEIEKYPIYYVDEPQTTKEIDTTIGYFQETIAKDKWLVVMLDHALLVESDNYIDERKIIAELQKVFIKRKKIGKTSIIQLSQMNRNIEMPERVLNPTSHYPMRSDLSSSDSIFQGSDVVAALSRPEMLGITEYGPNRLPTKNKVYLHFLKCREGSIGILEFENELKYNNLKEI